MRRWSGILVLIVAVSGCGMFASKTTDLETETERLNSMEKLQGPRFYRPGSSARGYFYNSQAQAIEESLGYRH